MTNETNMPIIRRRTSSRAARALTVTGVLALAACHAHETLLDVQTPDIVSIATAETVAGAQAFYTAGVGEFSRLVGGDRNGSSPLGLNLAGGLFGDELFSARTGTEHYDSRSQNPNLLPASSWNELGTAYTRVSRAINLLEKYPPATGGPAQLALLHALKGYTLTLGAEHFCNGIPIWDGKSDDATATTITVTNDEMYGMALTEFTTADSLATVSGNTQVKSLAAIGKGRTIVDKATPATLQASLAQAAAVVASVPVTFVYNAVFTNNSTGVGNAIYDWSNSTRNFGASDKEGINGLPYVSAKDPRVKVDATKTRLGQDGTSVTPLLNQYPTLGSPIPVSTGIEGLLIKAESQLATDPAGFIVTLNQARTTIAGLAPLTDPGTADARRDLLFKERGFWFYLTAHRLGDMRRLVRQYGLDAESVYPTGPYFKGGTYGKEVVMMPSIDEQNNPSGWKSCSDTKA